jgi:medium-chain acyl-[acyl-carrier-protein] hydrolase
LLEMLLPILRADCTAHELYQSHYQQQDPFEFPIWVYGGLGDDTVTRERLDAWSIHTSGESRVHMIMGGHLFVDDMPPPLIDSLARRLYAAANG